MIQNWIHKFKFMGKPLQAAMIISLLGGCSDYAFKFNERPIYTPLPLFTDYDFVDPALEDCVEQTIQDKKITAAEDLKTLVCTSAGIIELEGIGVFSSLQQLNLAHNEIADLQPLAQLLKLKELDLSGNAVTSVAPLHPLTLLEWVDLTRNPGLNCRQAQELKELTDATVVLPEHCVPTS
jgi:hypothetical protein